MKIMTNRSIVLKCGIVAFQLSLWLFCSHMTMADSDYVTFKRLLDRVDTSYDAIHTWQGKALVRETVRLLVPIDARPDEQYTKYAFDYAFDRKTGNFISTADLQEEYSDFGKDRKHLRLPNINYMRKEQLCFRFRWNSIREAETFAWNDGNFVSSSGESIARIVHVLSEPFALHNSASLHLLFDPFAESSFDALARVNFDSLNHTDDLRSFITVMDMMKITDFDELAKVEGSVISLDTSNDQYVFEFNRIGANRKIALFSVFDLKQGGNVISFKRVQEGSGGIIVQSHEWRATYEKVGGCWIPKKTSTIFSTPRMYSEKVVDWYTTTINEPISDSVFSLQNLGLHRGDIIYDARIQQEIIITGDDFPPPFHSYNIKDMRHTKTRYVLISIGALFVLVALFRMYRKWRTKHLGG